jgi:hypothetical protein
MKNTLEEILNDSTKQEKLWELFNYMGLIVNGLKKFESKELESDLKEIRKIQDKWAEVLADFIRLEETGKIVNSSKDLN